MADFPELYRQGADIAKLIWDGKPDEAHPQYDALINRIQQETKNDPAEQQRQKDYVCKAMNQMDPVDVKSPGHGAAEGFCFVYWDTQNKVSDTMAQLTPFLTSHPKWNARLDKLDPASKTDLDGLVASINKQLAEKITDPLEPYTFVADFNRRANENFRAFRNSVGKAEIKLNDGN